MSVCCVSFMVLLVIYKAKINNLSIYCLYLFLVNIGFCLFCISIINFNKEIYSSVLISCNYYNILFLFIHKFSLKVSYYTKMCIFYRFFVVVIRIRASFPN